MNLLNDRTDGDLPDVFSLLSRHREQSGLLVPGYVELNSRPRHFALSPTALYFESTVGHLCLSVDDITGHLSLIDAIIPETPVHLLNDDSIEPMFVDLFEFYLGVANSDLDSAILYFDQNSDVERMVFRAALLNYRELRSLLIDPLWPAGIMIRNGTEVSNMISESNLELGAIAVDLNRGQ